MFSGFHSIGIWALQSKHTSYHHFSAHLSRMTDSGESMRSSDSNTTPTPPWGPRPELPPLPPGEDEPDERQPDSKHDPELPARCADEDGLCVICQREDPQFRCMNCFNQVCGEFPCCWRFSGIGAIRIIAVRIASKNAITRWTPDGNGGK